MSVVKEVGRRLIGGVWQTGVGDESTGNGGSQSGSVQTKQFLFTETAGAGVYTAALDIPAESFVYGWFIKNLSDGWDADTANVLVGDSDSPISWSGEFGFDVNFGFVGFTFADIAASKDSIFASDGGGAYPDGTTLNVTLTTTGAGGTKGRTIVGVMYVSGPNYSAAVKS